LLFKGIALSGLCDHGAVGLRKKMLRAAVNMLHKYSLTRTNSESY